MARSGTAQASRISPPRSAASLMISLPSINCKKSRAGNNPHLVVTDQLVLGIRIHVVLVAVEALTVLLGPARILVFLPVFRAVLLPFLWCLAGLHGLILFAAITLLRDRHDRGIN